MRSRTEERPSHVLRAAAVVRDSVLGSSSVRHEGTSSSCRSHTSDLLPFQMQGIEKEEMLASTPDSLLRERTSESEGCADSHGCIALPLNTTFLFSIVLL